MTIQIADTLRTARADLITAARDAGIGAGKIRLYDGVRPSKGGVATTLLAELTFSATSAPAASTGVLTASAITGDTSADNTGTASWFREVDGDNVFILDGDIGLTGSDLNLNTLDVVSGLPVNITSYVTTEGND